MLVSCSLERKTPINITFELHNAQNPQQNTVQTLRFYLHNISLINQKGTAIPVELEQHEPHQYHNVALLTLTPNAQSRQATVRGYIPKGLYQDIHFTLGLPFALNHANPLKAPSPLNLGELFWSWQLGYKFLRLDMTTIHGPWSLHLGSTGCHSPSPLRPPANACEQPNLVHIRLKNFNPTHDTIRFNLDRLLEESENNAQENCTGNFRNSGYCRHTLQHFGLDADNGLCLYNCDNQDVFQITNTVKP